MADSTLGLLGTRVSRPLASVNLQCRILLGGENALLTDDLANWGGGGGEYRVVVRVEAVPEEFIAFFVIQQTRLEKGLALALRRRRGLLSTTKRAHYCSHGGAQQRQQCSTIVYAAWLAGSPYIVDDME
jgi:hypothetical protein